MAGKFTLYLVEDEMGERGMRGPVGSEELLILEDMDRKTFKKVAKSVDRDCGNRDPAYMAWATRRHWFRHWYPLDIVTPEMRPSVGGRVIRSYDSDRPWYVPGLENLKRECYPKAWDEYVMGAIKLEKSLTPAAEVVESDQLLAVNRKLNAAADAKALREVQDKLDALEVEEEEAQYARMAIQQKRKELARKRAEAASIEVEKAEIRAANKTSGRQGFGTASTNSEPDSEYITAVAKANRLSSEKADLYTKLETATTKEKFLLDEIAKLTAQVEAAAETNKMVQRDLDSARNESRRLLQQLETRDEEEDILFTDLRGELETERTRTEDGCGKISALQAELRTALDTYKIMLSNKDGSILVLGESLKAETLRFEAKIQRLNDELTEEKSKSHDLVLEVKQHKVTIEILGEENSRFNGKIFESFKSRVPTKEAPGRQSKRARLDEHDEGGNSV